MEHGEDGGSEQPGSSDIGQSLALGKRMTEIIERQLKPIVISILPEVIGPIVEVLLPKLVQEELQKLEEKGLIGRNDRPNERTLKLKFLDKVSDTETGGVLKGTNNKCLKLALFDSNGEYVTRGDASSAEVEILLIDNGNSREGNITHENFVRSIIPTGEKKKPHLAKRAYIYLKNGVGECTDLKLGSGPWIKSCNCRLGAKIAQSLGGISVQDAWSSPFKVIDYRNAHYVKHNPPSLTSEVWRLDEICKDGKRRIRLEEKNIKNLQDFLFMLNVKPEELKKIYTNNHPGDRKWNITVAHARTCNIDDKKMYFHKSATEPEMCVIYDVVGNLKGEIIESHFVPLSADRKDHAHELLASAFQQRYETYYEDEASLLRQFPSRSLENIAGYQPDLSSPSINPTASCDSMVFEGLDTILDLVEFDAEGAYFSTGGPKTVGGSSNVALYSDGGEDPLPDCFSKVDRNECNADEVKIKFKAHFHVMMFAIRLVEDVNNPIRKKRRVAAA